MILAELAILAQPISEHPRTMREAREIIDRSRERSEAEAKAKESADRYVKSVLKERHIEFIHAFNLYLDGYRRGSVNHKHLKDAVDKFDKLRKTEGFREYVSRDPR